MKIQYIGEEDSWLKINNTYIVLAIHVNKREGAMYRLLSGDGSAAALHPARLFKIIDGGIPSSWIVHVGDKGNYLEICPATWAHDGFWEKYFDRDSEAMSIFEKESYRITTEED